MRRRAPYLLLLLMALTVWLVVASVPSHDSASPVHSPGSGPSDPRAPGLKGRRPFTGSGSDCEAVVPTGSPGELHEAQRENRSIRIKGIVVDVSGRPVPAMVHASGTGGGIRSSVSFRTRRSGRFEGVLSLPKAHRDVVIVGQGTVRGEMAVTYPSRHRVAPDSNDAKLNVILVARAGAQVEGIVPRSSDRHVRVLLSQFPVGADEQYTGWNAGGFAVVDRMIRPDADGAFSAVVRPGRFQARMVSEDGSVGPVESGIALAGQVVNIGQLLAPRRSVRFSLTIVDDRDAPIPGAWVQLPDRSIHLVSGREEAEFPHFVAGVDGVVEIGCIPMTDLPMETAIGSADHAIRGFELSERETSPRVILHSRRLLTLRLTGEGASSFCAQDPGLVRVGLGNRAGRASWVESAPLAQRLHGATQMVAFGISDARRCLAWVHRPPAGAYDLTLHVGPTAVAHRRIEVSDGLGDEDVIDLPIVRGHLVRARLTLPPEINRVLARSMMQIQLRSGGGDRKPIDLATGPFLDGDGEVAMWLPLGQDVVSVASRNTCLLPLVEETARLSRGDVTIVRPRIMEDVGFLTIGVTGIEGRSVAASWPLLVANFRRDDCGPGIIGLMSRADGELSLVLRSGEYEVRSDRSLVKPFARARIVVRRGETCDVDLAILR